MVAIITEGDAKMEINRAPLWNRLLWFVALWGLGVLTIFAVGSAIRYFIFP